MYLYLLLLNTQKELVSTTYSSPRKKIGVIDALYSVTGLYVSGCTFASCASQGHGRLSGSWVWTSLSGAEHSGNLKNVHLPCLEIEQWRESALGWEVGWLLKAQSEGVPVSVDMA